MGRGSYSTPCSGLNTSSLDVYVIILVVLMMYVIEDLTQLRAQVSILSSLDVPIILVVHISTNDRM